VIQRHFRNYDRTSQRDRNFSFIPGEGPTLARVQGGLDDVLRRGQVAEEGGVKGEGKVVNDVLYLALDLRIG
jgi:hypothetical protein